MAHETVNITGTKFGIKLIWISGAGMVPAQRAQVLERAKDHGVINPAFDDEGMMTSDNGAVYATPGCNYITQSQIDAARRKGVVK